MPTKIVEVVVTGIVGPKPFPIKAFLVGLLIVTFVVGVLVLAGVQFQQQQQQTADSLRLVTTDLNKVITVIQLGDLSREALCSMDSVSCSGGYPSWTLTKFGEYKITNNSTLGLSPSFEYDTDCTIKGWQYLPSRYALEPKATMIIYCGVYEDNNFCPELAFYVEGYDWTRSQTITLCK